MAASVLVYCGLLLFGSVCAVADYLTVVVDGMAGTDNDTCLLPKSAVKCRSLEFVADHLTQKELVEIEIESGALNLTGPVEFTDFSHLTISGHSVMTNISCNQSGAGLAFVGVQNLTLDSLIIERCGAERDSTSVDPQTPNVTECLRVAVYVLNCTNVSINRVDIQFSNGTGLSLYDTNGTVDISDSNFTDNTLGENAFEPGGGGLRIEFTICTPGIVGNCSGTVRSSNYIIENCNFCDNSVTQTGKTTAAVPKTGKGGGLYISFGSNAYGINFTITGCNFLNNSADISGGGMLVEYLDSVQANMVTINDTTFSDNRCLASGGGLTVAMLLKNDNQIFTGNTFLCNTFQCNDCIFSNNTAYVGGGVAVFSTKLATAAINNSVTFSHCHWTTNNSPLGAAVYSSPQLRDFMEQGYTLKPVFADCSFVNNSAYQVMDGVGVNITASSVGFGAVFISKTHVRFERETLFSDGIGSALYLSNGIVEFGERSRVEFCNNKGHNGGAIAMYGSSVFRIGNNSEFDFTDNIAHFRGSDIYAEIINELQAPFCNCFIESLDQDHPRTNSVLRFSSDIDSMSRHAIFAASFQSCKLSCSDLEKSPGSILNCTATFYINASLIGTPPKKFMFHDPSNGSLKVQPGIPYSLDLTAIDENNATLERVTYEATTFENGENLSVTPEVDNDNIVVFGALGTSGKVNIDTRSVSLSVNLTLSDCRPGYYFTQGDKIEENMCMCESSRYLGLKGCSPIVYLEQGIWIGYCSNTTTKLCTTYCPFGFCSYHRMNPEKSLHPLPTDSSNLDSYICGPYRTGPVCSECVKGRTVYFHSWKYFCGRENICFLGWFFYLVSELLPLTLIFVLILVLNVTFTSGHLSSFVLFAQILDSLRTDISGLVVYPESIKVTRTLFTFCYQFFNLNFFALESLSFCLWKNANVLDIVLMKYATVGFALVLVFLTIFVVRCRCFRLHILHTPNSVLIHGLSAFFILCYSQCARTTFHILNYFCLYSIDQQCEETFVYRVGYMTYFKGEHVKYASVAVVVLIFMVILPPVLLMVYPLGFKVLGLCRLSESRLTGILWRLMPIQLLDAFQSSFKDEYRFFAGFYFLYRALILGAFAYSRTLTAFYITVQIQLTVVLALHAIFQPYKSRRHNIVDALLFTNLAFINGLSLSNYTASIVNSLKMTTRSIHAMASVQNLLISLPLLIVVIIAVEKVLAAYKARRRMKRSQSQRFGVLPPLRGDETYEKLP